jgi:hypothetical protein
MLCSAFLKYMTFEMVFMIRLPRTGTQVTEVFSAYTGHEVTAGTSLDCLFAPWAEFSIDSHPFGISLLFHDIFHPKFFLITCAGTMIIRVAFEAENFATGAFDTSQIQIIDFDTVSAIYSSTELIVTMDG